MSIIPVDGEPAPIKAIEKTIIDLVMDFDCTIPAWEGYNFCQKNLKVPDNYCGQIENVVWADVVHKICGTKRPLYATGPLYFSDFPGDITFLLRNETNANIRIPKNTRIAYFVLKPVGITQYTEEFVANEPKPQECRRLLKVLELQTENSFEVVDDHNNDDDDSGHSDDELMTPSEEIGEFVGGGECDYHFDGSPVWS